MRLLALALLCSCASLPEPGTPEASRACAQLIGAVPLIDRYYPEREDSDARYAFLLQVSDYAERLRCGPIGLPYPLEPLGPLKRKL